MGAEGENARIVRAVYDAFNQGDLPAFLGHIAPDVEWLPFFAAAVEGRALHGHDGVRQWLEELAGGWDDFRAEPDELRESGERVLVIGRLLGTGQGASVPVEQAVNWVWELRDGKVVSLRAYRDRARAIAAFEGLP